MSTPNMNVELQAILTVTDNLLTPPPYTDNYDFQNPTCGATNLLKLPFFQATTGGAAVTLPASPVFFIFVQNLSSSGALLHVTHTPTGGSASTCSIGQGGVVILYDPLETGGGFTALTLTGIGGTVPAFVMVGA